MSSYAYKNSNNLEHIVRRGEPESTSHSKIKNFTLFLRLRKPVSLSAWKLVVPCNFLCCIDLSHFFSDFQTKKFQSIFHYMLITRFVSGVGLTFFENRRRMKRCIKLCIICAKFSWKNFQHERYKLFLAWKIFPTLIIETLLDEIDWIFDMLLSINISNGIWNFKSIAQFSAGLWPFQFSL